MKITPLVLHAFVQIPRYTALFSDPFPVTSIGVVQGGQVTINCASPHGVPVNSRIGVSITDALTPNAITAASVITGGDVLLTTAFDHDLTGSNDPQVPAWSAVVKLSGFTSSLLNGTRQLVKVRSRNQFVMRPGSNSLVSVTLNGAEKLLEKLEAKLVGWHAVTATSPTALVFNTPASVMRSYTVLTPVVVRNLRIFGALNPEIAYRQYTDNAANKAAMFICPAATVSAVRAGSARSGAVADLGPGVDYRQLLTDGFEVVTFMPSLSSAAHVASIDVSQGEILRSVLLSFNGLRLDRSELCNSGSYASVFASHGGAMETTNSAVYSHLYSFQSPAYLTNADAIAPWEWSNIDDVAIAQGTSPDAVLPIGAPALHELDFTGILHDGFPTPLLANLSVT
jgi:hypothetical protein